MRNAIRARQRAGGSEQGSLMLVFLVLIVVMAMSTVTVATVVRSNKVSRHANSFQQVLPSADVGVQRALFALNNDEAATLPTPCPTNLTDAQCFAATSPSYARTTAVGSSAGTWLVRHPSTLEYDVVSTSTLGGVTRTVTAQIIDNPRFPLAAFADRDISFRGGNTASSYNHLTQAANTGDGDTGSNGSIVFNGNATADGVMLYDYLTNPSGTRCSGTPCANLTTFGPKLDITSDNATAFISTQIAACQASTTLLPWVASQHNGQLAAGTQCYSSLDFDVNTTILGTDANPTKLYVTGNVTESKFKTVNIPASPLKPDASALQIYSLGTVVGLETHAQLGAAVFAPHATCAGNPNGVPSDSQVQVWGALVCSTISNQGGWSFNYDDALSTMGMGVWIQQHYAER